MEGNQIEMKAFRSRLESVLIVRQRLEKIAMGNYAKTLEAHRQAIERLEIAGGELNAAWQELRAQMLSGCVASEAMQSRRFIDSLETLRQKRITEANVATHRKNAAMQAMLFARQQREVVDKFSEREKKRYDYDCARAEQKLIDELPRRDTSLLSWMPAKTLE